MISQARSYSPEQVGKVLSQSGVRIESELDSHYIIFCPFHGNSRTPAGEVDKNNGLFFCFSCHYTCELPEIVMSQTGRSYFQAIRMIKSYEENSNLTSEIFSRLEDKPEYVGYDESQVEDLHSTAMSSNVAISYYTNRKITEQSMKKFKLGFSEKRQMVTIPVHSPDGLLLGFVGRSVEGKEFKNTPNLPKAKTLFNLFRVKTSKNIYVVESSFDAIRLDQCGLPAVATLGSNVSNFQIDLLKKYFNDIIVIADNDDAGASMVKKLKKNLSSKLTVLSLDSKYKDVGDMGDDQIRALSTDFDKSIISMLQ